MVSNGKKIIVVGGVAGGMSVAARARRLSESAQITVLEKSGYVSFANCGLPYYLGQEITDESALLVHTPLSLRQRFNLDVSVNAEVIEIKPEEKIVIVKDLLSNSTFVQPYDELVLSVGAKPIRPNMRGIDLPGIFALRSIEDTRAVENWIRTKRPKNVVITGAGFIGLEMAEQMVHRGLEVTLVDGLDHVLGPIDKEMAELVHQELVKHGVKLLLGDRLKEFREPQHVQTKNEEPKSSWVLVGNEAPIPADMVIMGLGVRPDIEMARKAGIEIGELGGIKVDQYLRTSKPNIWAVGDAIEVVQPVTGKPALIALGGPANRQGRMVADNIFGGSSTYKGSMGTAILRVFGLTVATVGLSEERLRKESVAYEVVRIHPSHHAGYYPGAKRIDLKLIFELNTGRILGAQAIGEEGVDKRIDIIATAMKAGMTVRDLADLELAYAPPFGSAKDPINLAGMVACNILDKVVEQADWSEITRPDVCVLDVRSSKERANGYIPESLHIPLPELRERMSELPKNKIILVHCQSGQRSYFAARQLMQNGFKAKNLSGGFLTYMTSKSSIATPALELSTNKVLPVKAG